MINKVILCGRLTRDPEFSTTSGGSELCKFSIAVTRTYKNSNGEYDADFINCVAWKDTASRINQYFSKGQRILVEGRWEANQALNGDGNKVTYHQCNVEKFSFVDKKSEDSDTAAAPKKSRRMSDVEDDDDEDDAPTKPVFRRNK